jgi:phospholipase D1/2
MATDFQNVDHWEDNKLDRTSSSRMGWSDVALSLAGPVVQDLRTHFAQRWNFIYDGKYSKKATRYTRLPETSSGAQQVGGYPSQQREIEGEGERGFGGDGESGERGLFGHAGGFRQKLYNRANEEYHEHVAHDQGQGNQQSHAEHGAQRGGADCQITRSSAKWSHNINTEVSFIRARQERIATPWMSGVASFFRYAEGNQPSSSLNTTNSTSTLSKMHTAKSSRTASTLCTWRISSS